MSSDNSRDAIKTPKVSNRGHHALLKQACGLLGRDYNVIVSFNSFREEHFTILCAFAILVVCTLAFGTSYSAIDYLLFDYVKPSIAGKPYELMEKGKVVIPAFFAFVIYVIDMSILNGHKSIKDKGRDDNISLFYFLKIGIFKILFSKPMLTFRIMLILCSAVLSSMFLIAKFNSQLMASSAYNHMLESESSAKKTTDENLGNINKENLTVQEQRKAFSDELLRLKGALRKVDVDRDRELTTIKTNYEKQELSEVERLDSCKENCQVVQSKIDNLARRKRADFTDARARYRNERNDISANIAETTSKLSALAKEYVENNSRIVQEKDGHNEYKIQLADTTEKYIENQKSFGALMRYMTDGDPNGRLISNVVFYILLVLFVVVDSSVLMLKFSYESLYDRKRSTIAALVA
jgi:hypothetical protein